MSTRAVTGPVGQHPTSVAAGLRVVVWDHLRVVREALADFLLDQAPIAGVVVAPDVDAAVRQVRAGADLLIMDVSAAVETTAVDGLEALRNLRIRVPTLLIGAGAEGGFIARVIAAGATGYCPKQAPLEQFMGIVTSVASGCTTVPADAAAAVAQLITGQLDTWRAARAAQRRLTPRERQILGLLAEGVQRREIARRLGLSSNTVRTHVGSLLAKLGVHTQVAVAAVGRQLLAAPTPFPADPGRLVVHGIGSDGSESVVATVQRARMQCRPPSSPLSGAATPARAGRGPHTGCAPTPRPG